MRIISTIEIGRKLFSVAPLPEGAFALFCPTGCLRVWDEEARIAQLVEQLIRNEQVVGSIPTAGSRVL